MNNDRDEGMFNDCNAAIEVKQAEALPKPLKCSDDLCNLIYYHKWNDAIEKVNERRIINIIGNLSNTSNNLSNLKEIECPKEVGDIPLFCCL